MGFCAAIAEFQATVPVDDPLAALDDLRALVRTRGSTLLREHAVDLDTETARVVLRAYRERRDTTSPRAFFARVLLAPMLAAGDAGVLPGGDPDLCPRCAHRPQVGCFRPEGDGSAFSLQCVACLWEWPCERHRCPACGVSDQREIVYFGAPDYPQVQVRACESCRCYLHAVSLDRDPEAIPDIDEVAALPLDIWARERGYQKLHRNLVGA